MSEEKKQSQKPLVITFADLQELNKGIDEHAKRYLDAVIRLTDSFQPKTGEK